MRLHEIQNPDKVYRAQISFFSRGNSRRGYWSTKELQDTLESHGYTMEPYFDRDPSRRGKALIQKVEITGTRDEIIKAREEINRILRIKSNGVIRPKFELIN